ncbi:MAG: hypothetical protein ACXABY_26685 [Candidatus Thorarchaeota archaeon]|jgi:hypothetical protein
MKYRRPYYNSPFTIDALDVLPPWMKMRENKKSTGWQFMNALYGVEGELIQQQIDDSGRDLFLPSANIFQPDVIYKTLHTDTPIGASIFVAASGGAGVSEADDLYTFFQAPPTRVSEEETLYFDHFDDEIIGFTVAVDYDPSGVWRMRDGHHHTAYLLNRDILATDYSNEETEVYNEDRSTIAFTYNFARRTQSWEETGKDEIANFSSGSYTLQYTPIPSSLKVLDFLNLDSSGNATEVSSYTLDVDRIDQVGYSPENLVPSGWRSSYIVEYDYSVASKLGPMTMSRSFWDVDRWNQIPLIAAVPPLDNLGMKVPFEFVNSEHDHTVAMRVRPDSWRPGATGWVDFTFGAMTSGVWADDSEMFHSRPGDEPYFVRTTPPNSVVVYDESTRTRLNRSIYRVDGSGLNNSDIYISPIDSGFTDLTVYVNYEAQVQIEATSVQAVDAYSAASDLFPNDIFMPPRRRLISM